MFELTPDIFRLSPCQLQEVAAPVHRPELPQSPGQAPLHAGAPGEGLEEALRVGEALLEVQEGINFKTPNEPAKARNSPMGLVWLYLQEIATSGGMCACWKWKAPKAVENAED